VGRFGKNQEVEVVFDLYLYYPDGGGQSKLTNALIEKRLGVAGTTRNWNTCSKLLTLTHPKG
ncbi:MAG TPA: DUF1697 domain-containing protein, partial [Thermoanaerobaculia bacterium]|nr:DUF1697 domain-containing protein [Thermoanaerobaculia bacterium]